jgi:hypothetical protein
MSWLSGTDLQGLIASGGAALQLSEDVAEARVPDWQSTKRRSAPTSLQRELCGFAESNAPVFSALALGSGYGVLLQGSGTLHSSGGFTRSIIIYG